MTAPAFRFLSANSSRGTISTGEGSTEFYHPLLPACLVPAAGFLLILNGWNLNRCMSDITGHDDTAATAVHTLQMRAPREPLEPLVSPVGEGRTFRPGAKFRYRWRNALTGECSGLSPIPTTSLNLGVETTNTGTTYLGQTSYFYIPTTNKPASADTLDLFANTTEEDDVWYLADSKSTSTNGTPDSYVLVSDNSTDDELFTRLAVISGSASSIPAGMEWSEGLMWPVVKAWPHPTGRTVYYGIRRRGRIWNYNTRLSVTQGSDLVTMSATGNEDSIVIEPGRIGQRLNIFLTSALDTPLPDPTVYRIVKVESSTTFRISPEIQISGYIPEGTTSGDLRFTIEDDRDARYSWVSEPNIPWLIDPLKILAAGSDFDDGPMAWFTVGSNIFIQTKRRIYQVMNSLTDDLSKSTLFISGPDEGTVGFFSGCETPFGWVYVHENRGVRYFDGVNCFPLGALGDAFQEFQPQTQFSSFEPTMLEEVRCFYDAEHRAVIVGYVPTGESVLKECLVFSSAERVWRGPYKDCVYSAGYLRTTASANTFVVGDNSGNLLTREAQARDVVPTLSGVSTYPTGTITAVDTKRVFTDSTGVFNNDSDERLRGSPIWFVSSTGVHYFARISDVLSGVQLELEAPPVAEDGTLGTLTTGWTYHIGAIRWSIKTAYIDGGGDPCKPIEAHKLHVRFRRGTVTETFEASASENANGTFSGPRTSSSAAAVDTRDVNAHVHGELRLKREGALVQLQLRGLAKYGEPEITRATLIMDEREGALA